MTRLGELREEIYISPSGGSTSVFPVTRRSLQLPFRCVNPRHSRGADRVAAARRQTPGGLRPLSALTPAIARCAR